MLNGSVAVEFQGRQRSEIIYLKSFGPSTFIYDHPNWILLVFSNLELKNQLEIRLFENPNYRKDFLSIKMSTSGLLNLTGSR